MWGFYVEQKCCSTPYQQHDEKGEFSAWNSHLLCPSVPYLGVETTFTRHSRWVVKSEDSRSRDIYTWKHTDFSLLKTTSLEIKLVRWRKPKISVNSCDIVENWWGDKTCDLVTKTLIDCFVSSIWHTMGIIMIIITTPSLSLQNSNPQKIYLNIWYVEQLGNREECCVFLITVFSIFSGHQRYYCY